MISDTLPSPVTLAAGDYTPDPAINHFIQTLEKAFSPTVVAINAAAAAAAAAGYPALGGIGAGATPGAGDTAGASHDDGIAATASASTTAAPASPYPATDVAGKRFVWLFDMAGYGLRHATLIRIALGYARTFSHHYPETLEAAVLVSDIPACLPPLSPSRPRCALLRCCYGGCACACLCRVVFIGTTVAGRLSHRKLLRWCGRRRRGLIVSAAVEYNQDSANSLCCASAEGCEFTRNAFIGASELAWRHSTAAPLARS